MKRRTHISLWVCVCILGVVLGAYAYLRSISRPSHRLLAALVQESRSDSIWYRDEAKRKTSENELTRLLEKAGIKWRLRPVDEDELSPDELCDYVKYMCSHPDSRSLLVLLTVRRRSPEIYATIPEKVKASILCSALTHMNFGDLFGDICGNGPDSDNEAGEALRSTGRSALEFLVPMLNDHLLIGLTGSERWFDNQYPRRCDYAYRFICLILDRKPVCHDMFEDRDKEIQSLKTELKSKGEE